MPICHLETNLEKCGVHGVPDDLQIKLSKIIACTLNKPEERVSVTIHAGLPMCRGGSSEPTVTLRIWAVAVFCEEKNPEYAEKFFTFFKKELPNVCDKRIVMQFLPLEKHEVVIRC